MFRLLAGSALHTLYDLRAMFYGTAGTGCILKTLQPLAGKTAAPLTDGHFRQAQFASDLLIGPAGSGRQNNPAALHQTLRSRGRSHQLVQRGFHRRIERDSGSNSRHVPTVVENLNNTKNYMDDVLVCSWFSLIHTLFEPKSLSRRQHEWRHTR